MVYICAKETGMRHFLLMALVWICQAATAQTNLAPMDKSPMDMAYYPVGYPLLKIADKAVEPLLARVIYSRPLKNGRVVFGEMLEYGKIWRLGANEATELELYQPVKIGNAKVKKGRYTLYCIPTPTQWTVILNKETDTWGAFKYDEKKDVARVTLPVEKLPEPAEAFTIQFEKGAKSINLVIAWDNAKVVLPMYQ
jgi:hypothetical protein